VGLSIKQRVLHDVKTCVKFAIGALAVLSSNSSSVNVKAASDKRGPVDDDDDDDDDVSDRQAVLEVALLVVVGAQLLCGGLDHLELLVNYESVFS
jgi:hypothetical protein